MIQDKEPPNKIKKVTVNGRPAIQMYLTLKKATLLDPEDYEKVKHLKWIAVSKENYFYVISHYQESPNKQKIIYLNKMITGISENERIHYKNRLSLDNRRKNLLVVSKEKIYSFRRRTVKSISGYKGVHWDKDREVYNVCLSYNKERYCLGVFKNKHRAAIVYDKAAQHYIGPFAHTNFRASLKKDHIMVKTIDY